MMKEIGAAAYVEVSALRDQASVKKAMETVISVHLHNAQVKKVEKVHKSGCLMM